MAAARFQLDDGGVPPPWLAPERFEDAAFVAEAYVDDLRRVVPLDDLGAELRRHADALRARLVEGVNADYGDFVDLSTRLVDVDGGAAAAAAPLRAARARVEAARGAAEAQAAALAAGLARRQAAAAARAQLELARDAALAVAKVEKLLEEGAGEGIADSALDADANGEALEARARLLDRLCAEASRLRFYRARGGELALVRALAPRAEAAEAALAAALDAALRAALRAQSPSALAALLRAYAALGRAGAAEAVVRAEVAAPAVARAAEAATAAAGGAGAPPPLPALLEALAAGLREELGGFLAAAAVPGDGPQPFDFLGRAALPEAAAAAAAAAPGAASAGDPAAFQANYRAAARFLEALEGMAATAAQVERLRAAPAAAELLCRWNLAAYFALRFREVAGALEAALGAGGLVPAAADGAAGGAEEEAALPPPPELRYVASAAAWAAWRRCVAPDVFLPPLADRFLRLALQAAARYATWVTEGLRRGAAGAGTAAVAEGDEGGAAADAAGADAAAAPWAADATAEQLAALWADCGALARALEARFAPAFAAAAGAAAADGAAAEAVAAALADAGAALGAAGEAALAAAAAGLADRCCEALKQLRGIVATFRMTARAAPTRPSHYVASVLAPLLAFLEAAGLEAGGAPRAALARAVVAGVAARFAALAEETLESVRRTESSLRRLKTRKAGGGEEEGGAPAAGADALIAAQLFLDAQEFGRRCGAAGVAPAELEPFRALWRAVAPPERAGEVAL